MSAWSVAPFSHPWTWVVCDDPWERDVWEGTVSSEGRLRLDDAGQLVVTVLWTFERTYEEALDPPGPEQRWESKVTQHTRSLDWVLAAEPGLLHQEQLEAYWRGLTTALKDLRGERALYGWEDLDVDVFGVPGLVTWEDFCLELTTRARVGEALGEVYWRFPAPVWLRTELRSCFPMGGRRVYLNLAMNGHRDFQMMRDDPEALVIQDRSVVRGVVRLFVEDESGSLRDCLEQEFTLAEFAREIDPQRFLAGMRAHAVVLGELLGEATDRRDWMPFELICSDIFGLKRARTQEDFEAALRVKSRLGKWL